MINSRDLLDLKPPARKRCEDFIADCERAGIKVKIIQTLRDAEYQNYLFQQGRTRTGDIITNADGYAKKSNHQNGLAWDAVPLDASGKILWNDKAKFRQMADIAVSLGIRAGYYWKTLPDSPHFEYFGA